MKKGNKIQDSIFILLFLVFSLGQLGRISFINQQINGYLYEFIMAALLFFWFLKDKIKPLQNAYKDNPSFFWFVGWTLLTFAFGLGKYRQIDNFISLLYQFRLIFYFLFFVYAKNKIPKLGIKIFIIVTAIIAVLQYLLYPDLRNLLYSGWDPHLYRVFGVYFDTYVAVTVFGLCFFYLLFQKRSRLNIVLLILYFILLIMTFSRLGYLAFTITLFLIYIKDLKKFLILLGLIALVIIFLPKPQGEGVNLGRIFSIESRMLDYQAAVKTWRLTPLTGIGYNRIRYYKQDLLSHSGASFHSSFMIVLATTGIIGFALFLMSLLNLAKMNIYASYLVIFVSLISLGDNALLHPFILLLLLSLLSFSRR